MPRIGEQITQNGRIMEWQGDMWIDIGEANIPPGVRVGSVADLRPGIDFPFPQGPNVEWEKFYGPYDQPMMRGKYLDPYNPDLGAMYASSRLNPDTMQYGPLTQSEKPVTSYYASGDPTTHQERLQNRIDAMPKGSIRDRQNAMNRDLDNINLPKQQTPFSVRRDVGPELEKDGGYKMDDPNIANLSYFNPEEEILETIYMVDGKIPEERIPTVPQSKSSENTKLSMQCSYCEFKFLCWENLRTFIYSSGPEYLVDVVQEPRVPEVFHD